MSAGFRFRVDETDPSSSDSASLTVRVCESPHEAILCEWHGLPAIECSSFCNVHRLEVYELD